MKTLWKWLWKNLWQSLGFLLPLGITVWIILWLWGYVKKVLGAFNVLGLWFSPKVEGTELWLAVLSFFLILVLILGIGILVQGLLGRWIHSVVDNIVDRFPGINGVYKSVKQLFVYLFRSENNPRGEVVMVKAFHDRVYSLGFLVGEMAKENTGGKKLYKVFVPGVPNISSGFLLLVDEKDIFRLDTSLDQASLFLVSFGLLKEMRKKL